MESGELARGTEDLEKAANIQRAALSQLVSLVEEKPDMRLPRLDLARVYGELGEIEAEAGNPEQALALLEKAMGWIDGLLAEEPDSAEALYQKARRGAAQAKIFRDQGKGLEAEKLVSLSLEILGRLAERSPENADFQRQLGLVLWQKAELQGDLSRHGDAVATLRQAMEILSTVAIKPGIAPDALRRLNVNLGYLEGDLGHQLAESNQKAPAIAAFSAAIARWKQLVGEYGADATTEDALAWCERRLKEMQDR